VAPSLSLNVFNRKIGTTLLVAADDVDATLVANRRANSCNDDIVSLCVTRDDFSIFQKDVFSSAFFIIINSIFVNFSAVIHRRRRRRRHRPRPTDAAVVQIK
jgi:hypothetical protein